MPKTIMHTYIDCTDFGQLQKLLDDLRKSYGKAKGLQDRLSKNIIKEYFAGNIVILEKQLLTSMEIINAMDEGHLKRMDEEVKIRYRTTTPLEHLELDARGLLDYMEKGNSISKSPTLRGFLPKRMKQRLYITRKVKVNGNPCNTKESLVLVIQDLRLKQGFRKLSRLWDLEVVLTGAYHFQYDFFKKSILTAIDLITEIENAENIRKEIQKTSNLRLQPFEEKCTVSKRDKKIDVSDEVDDVVEYSFDAIACHFSEDALNIKKE